MKAAWYGSEQLGNLLGLMNGKPMSEPVKRMSAERMTREDVNASIRADYEQKYFISGKGDMIAYKDDCVFADPFVSYKGVARFKRNISNLGDLMENVRLQVYDVQATEYEIRTKWKFSCILDLPWRPKLAAAGSTVHVLDEETNKVVKHIEDWDVEPGQVLKSLLKPASKVPENEWEDFFLALSQNDYQKMWFQISTPTTFSVTPIILASLVAKISTGSGFEGVFWGSVEGICFLIFMAGLFTEAVKYGQRMQNGDKKSGGRF